MTGLSAFDELCKEAALRFLRSAVVVDDRPVRPRPPAQELQTPDLVAVLEQGPEARPTVGTSPEDGPPPATGNATTVGEAVVPVARSHHDAFPDAGAEPPAEGPDSAGDERDLKELDLVDAFAEQGIACAVLTPPIVGHSRIKAAARADVLVVDWRLGQTDNGEEALALIEEISDAKEPAGRRLVCIYTSVPDLDEVVIRLAAQVGVTVATGERIVDTGSLRIVVLAKAHLASDGVSESDLPARLVKEFVVTFRGLVPAVAVNALAAVRDNLPRVLGRLGPDLDEGYVGHTLMLDHPGDAVDHIRALIGDELRTVIDDEARTADAAGAEGILSWMEDRGSDLVGHLAALDKQLKGGPPANIEGIGKKDRTKILVARSDARAQMANVRFANRMAFRIHYPGGTPRSLEPGVILRDQNGKYYICVQPLCDSVRLKPPSAQFPFLPCPPVAPGKQFNFCLVDGDSPVLLGLDNKFHSVAQIRFGVDPELRTISLAESMVEVVGGDPEGASRSFHPVGLLRPDHAKRLSQGVGTEVARIGLDESEWGRLWAPRTGE
jgi:hypothetical protein